MAFTCLLYSHTLLAPRCLPFSFSPALASCSPLPTSHLFVPHICSTQTRRLRSTFPIRCQSEEANGNDERVPFGYTRKDVILIGIGLTVFGVGLKYGLELAGLDSLKSGNVVQLVMVLGLTIGWISTYVFRVSTKEMTYAKQLKDYEKKVMEKRLEELPEAELESLLAQVEEEKRRLQQRQKKP